MIEYTWKIEELATIPQAGGYVDVVVRAFWTVTGSDGEFIGSFRGLTDFTLDETKNFTPFEEIAESQIISWVKEAITPDRLQIIEAEITAQIEAEKNPPTQPQPQPLPWLVK